MMGVRAETKNETVSTALEKYNQGAVDMKVTNTYANGDGEQNANLSNGGTFQSFDPAKGDSFVRNQEADGRYSLSTIDSGSGIANIGNYDSQGQKIAERYEFPQ
jgi:hypothetical protein